MSAERSATGGATGSAAGGVAGGATVLAPEVDETARATPVDEAAPRPDIGRTGRALTSARTRSTAMWVLALLATFYTIYFARDFLLPITVALLLDFLLSPVVRGLSRLRIPIPLGAALVVLTLVGGVAFGVYQLADPVQRWAAEAPTTLSGVQQKVRKVLRPVQQVTRTAEQVERQAAVTPPTGAREVVVRPPSIVSRVFGATQKLVAGLLEVFFLLYFLLASGDLFLQKLVKVIPREEAKHGVVKVARAIETAVSTYLLSVTMINISEGVVVAGAMYLLHMPNPVLWGTMVALLEFVPYLGATVMTLVLTFAALTTFDVGHALLVPGAYLTINLLQANVVSPMLLGHRLTLNPVAIFVGLTFWFFMWGVPGAFIAVPVLAALKTVCDHAAPLAALGEFLGQRDERERRWVARA